MSRPPPREIENAGRPHPLPDAWQSTRALTALATQFVNEDDYLATPRQEVGRVTGAHTHELFVSCDPAQALQQQFEHLQPDFIAVHDIGTRSARKLLVGIAAASGRKLQKLLVRRQGYGTLLAELDFVELPTEAGISLRMYAAGAEAAGDATPTADGAPPGPDPLACTLLGHSRLAVLMVGELAPAALAGAFEPIRAAMAGSAWANRHLLLMPLTPGDALVERGRELAAGTRVDVRTTPLVTRPADAWAFISASWSRLADSRPAAGAAAPSHRPSSPASTTSPRLRPLRAAPVVAALPVPTPERRRPAAALPAADTLERYLRQLGQLVGMIGCCVFEVATGREVAHAGTGPSGSQLALHGTQLLASMATASRTLGLGHAPPDVAITLGDHHLLLREVPRHAGLALHALLDKTAANLTLVRLQIQRMDALFDESTKPA